MYALSRGIQSSPPSPAKAAVLNNINTSKMLSTTSSTVTTREDTTLGDDTNVRSVSHGGGPTVDAAAAASTTSPISSTATTFTNRSSSAVVSRIAIGLPTTLPHSLLVDDGYDDDDDDDVTHNRSLSLASSLPPSPSSPQRRSSSSSWRKKKPMIAVGLPAIEEDEVVSYYDEATRTLICTMVANDMAQQYSSNSNSSAIGSDAIAGINTSRSLSSSKPSTATSHPGNFYRDVFNRTNSIKSTLDDDDDDHSRHSASTNHNNAENQINQRTTTRGNEGGHTQSTQEPKKHQQRAALAKTSTPTTAAATTISGASSSAHVAMMEEKRRIREASSSQAVERRAPATRKVNGPPQQQPPTPVPPKQQQQPAKASLTLSAAATDALLEAKRHERQQRNMAVATDKKRRPSSHSTSTTATSTTATGTPSQPSLHKPVESHTLSAAATDALLEVKRREREQRAQAIGAVEPQRRSSSRPMASDASKTPMRGGQPTKTEQKPVETTLTLSATATDALLEVKRRERQERAGTVESKRREPSTRASSQAAASVALQDSTLPLSASGPSPRPVTGNDLDEANRMIREQRGIDNVTVVARRTAAVITPGSSARQPKSANFGAVSSPQGGDQLQKASSERHLDQRLQDIASLTRDSHSGRQSLAAKLNALHDGQVNSTNNDDDGATTASSQQTTVVTNNTTSAHEQMLDAKRTERAQRTTASTQRPTTNVHSKKDNGDDGKRSERIRAATAATITLRPPQPRQPSQSPSSPTGSSIATTSRHDVMVEAKRRERDQARLYVASRPRVGKGDGQGGEPGHSVTSTATSIRHYQPYSQRSLGQRSKGEDDDLSTNSAYALAMARSNMQKSMKEANKLKEYESGPSLASATSGEVHPGAFALVGRELNAKEADDGPTLMRAQSGDDNLYLFMSSSSDANDDDNELGASTNQDDMPLVFPGAFAVQGLSGHDSESEFSSSSETDVEASNHTLEFPSQPETEALQAEVYEERVLIEDAVVAPVEGENVFDTKALKRLRMIQLAIFCVSLGAIGLIVGGALGFSKKPADRKPTVEGWRRIGGEVVGPTKEPLTLFGSSLAMSGDGLRLAIAAPGVDDADAAGPDAGAVYIMEETQNDNGTSWAVLDLIHGPGTSTQAHVAISMSLNSTSVAVGYPHLSEGSQVQVYREQNGAWSLMTQALTGPEKLETWFGYAVDLSADGSILAVGAPATDGPTGTKSGVVKVYQIDNNTWVQLGTDIPGFASDELFGWSLSLSSNDGFRVAVGAPVAGGTTGLVRIFDFNGTEWNQAGSDIVGDIPLNRFGESVSLSSDGIVLAVGARGSAFEPGQAQIFRDVNGVWVADQGKVWGTQPGEGFGSSVSLSSDGSVMAVGSPQSNFFGNGAGAMTVYQFNDISGEWKQQGSSIGSEEMAHFGAVVAMSTDGTRVAGGAPETAFVGSISRAGAAMVYDRENDATGEELD